MKSNELLKNKTPEELEQLIAVSTNAIEKVDALNLLAEVDMHNQPQNAIQLCKTSISIAQEHAYSSGVARAFTIMGRSNLHGGNYTEAMEYLQKANALYELHGDQKSTAHNINIIGNIHNDLGNYPKALEYYTQSIAICEFMGNLMGVATSTGNIGNVYHNAGNYALALEYTQKALKLNEAIDNKAGIAINTGNLGNIYSRLDKFDAALEYFNKALVISEVLNNLYNVAAYTANMGLVYLEQNNFSSALNCLQKAVTIHESTGNRAGVGTAMGNIGTVYYRWGNSKTALEYLQKAASICQEIGLKQAFMRTTSTIGDVYEKSGNYLVALEHYERALNIAQEIGDLLSEMDNHRLLADIHEKLGRTTEALMHFKKYHKTEKQLKNDEAHKKAATFDMQRQLDLKDKEHEVTSRILHNILPQKIAERIKNGEEEIIERFENCSVLFADIVGFTTWSANMSVHELAQHLNKIFQLFDELANQYFVEKIKTIGDAYMCVSGLPEPCADHAERMAKMALGMNEKIKEAYPDGEIKLRIGIHTGEVIAGVIGKNKYAYDLWGDTVNTASRMESHGVENKIQVSEEFKNKVNPQPPSRARWDETKGGLNANTKFRFEERGEIEVKGKGKIENMVSPIF